MKVCERFCGSTCALSRCAGSVVDPPREPGGNRPLQSASGWHVRQEEQGRRALPGSDPGGQRHHQTHHLRRSAQRKRRGQQGQCVFILVK